MSAGVGVIGAAGGSVVDVVVELGACVVEGSGADAGVVGRATTRGAAVVDGALSSCMKSTVTHTRPPLSTTPIPT